ncbi:hypothetical protein BHAP_0176 [Bifidobacterium hapali]|uniref:Uncharacterized protein n=1 Tax=Bifidobacterium hapali TaxID=1630172 RepID=A0A261G4H6_9BIFI|nr:hypothetical protein [Bifidobacterium hapali]OZG66314.1 hypothetical protein BHAP_0176 [Bifidobacterium hapali]
MVTTTLDFAEQYLLKTEIRTVRDSMPDGSGLAHRGTDGSIADGVIARNTTASPSDDRW